MRRRLAWFASVLFVVHAPLVAQQGSWSVEDPTGPSDLLSFTAEEGTWMSVDVSPDGSLIAFDLLGTIYEMPFEGGTATALTSGRSWNLSPRYSPDGSRLAFSSDRDGSHGVWVLNRTTGQITAVPGTPGQIVHRPTWIDGGRTIVGGASGDGIRSHLAAFTTGEPRIWVQGNGPVNGALTIPGTGDVVYEHQAAATYPFGFNPYVVPAGGSRIEIVRMGEAEPSIYVERPGGAFQPTPSPDGRRLAYLNRDLEGTRLILQEIGTRSERVLVTGLDSDRQDSRSAYGPHPNFAWHPGGEEILIAWGGKIRAVDASTGHTRVIPFRAPVERIPQMEFQLVWILRDCMSLYAKYIHTCSVQLSLMILLLTC